MIFDTLKEKYVGKTVEVTAELETYTDSKGEKMRYTSYTLDEPADGWIEQLREECTTNDLKLRIWLPDTVGTMDFRSNRVNVYIGKVGEEWKITDLKQG
jgi:hypothetical protein